MLRQQEHYLAKGGSKDDFVGKQDWAFLIAAMDLRVEVSPEAERISADILGVVKALLPNVTDQKGAPASC